MTSTTPRYVGIDVAKHHLDVAVRPGGDNWRVPHDADGLAALVARLHDLAPTLIVLEASGGYERPVVAALSAASLALAVINPRQTRDFAKATGKLAKTDTLDAAALAHFAEAVRPVPRAVADDATQALGAALTRRRQLLAMLAAEQNRLATALPTVRERIAAHIAWLKAEVADSTTALARAIQEDPAWREREALLRSVPGVGPILATVVLAELPELGTVTRQQAAALAGVAPLNRDSGTRRGKRATWGGRAHVRTALYMATMSAIRANPAIRAFYERLRAVGKPRKVAVVACMHKLLTVLNAVLRQRTPWADVTG